MSEKRVVGGAYWVTNQDWVQIAYYDPSAPGGWTNYDSWADYGDEVLAWQHIPEPTVNEIVIAALNE